MKALGNKIVLKMLTEDDTVVKKGIIIPSKAIENSKMCEGEVISIGPECKLGFKVGNIVLYDKYAINTIDNAYGVLAEDCIILAEA